MIPRELYISAPVRIETPTGWKERIVYTLGVLSCMLDDMKEYDYTKIHPIPLTSTWLLNVEDMLHENYMEIEHQVNRDCWILRDTYNGSMITTVKYQHELIKLFELLTGYDLLP